VRVSDVGRRSAGDGRSGLHRRGLFVVGTAGAFAALFGNQPETVPREDAQKAATLIRVLPATNQHGRSEVPNTRTKAVNGQRASCAWLAEASQAPKRVLEVGRRMRLVIAADGSCGHAAVE